MPGDAEVRLLTAPEAADVLRTNSWFITAECRSGRLRGYRPGRKWLIPEDAITEYLEAHCRPENGDEPEPPPATRRRRKRRVA